MSHKQIISTQVGAKTKYVLNAPPGVDKKRRPVLVDEIDKAKRFNNEVDANNYITFFANGTDRKYNVEPYQPAFAISHNKSVVDGN